ncbi:hypothetical protein B0J14DRAFT_96383 [Halenospora varia]|nr:hypothetical protein B0J14DRAFT_96383 [Halenospora varia]
MSSSQHPPTREKSNFSQSRQSSRGTETMAHSAAVPQRLRNDESWVEISSQPSSSSLSSIGDEIVTTGLRVQHDPNSRRRRRLQNTAPRIHLESRQTTSSQEEYEESESEEDHVMTSSNERITPATRLLNMPRPELDGGSSDEDDDDENSTALGRRTSDPVFTPQPNAFSHPPSSQHHRPSAPGSYFPSRRMSNERNPYSRRQSSYNHQQDHDAALRASLTTLLSIGAAAARGLPKRNGEQTNTINNTEPIGLRFVPESELLAPAPQPNTSRPLSPSTRARSSPSISSQEAIEKGKRKASTTATKSVEKTRAEKKRRKGTQVVAEGTEEALISPTLLTWVMSAGVLVLVSVVGFGAGYVIGREVGRQEVLGGLQGGGFSDGGSCGKEVMRGSGSGGLRRFKWGIGGGGRSVVA